jgi:hypothetical protein
VTVTYPYTDNTDRQLVASMKIAAHFLDHPVPIHDLPDYSKRACRVTPVVDFPQPHNTSEWLPPRYDTMPLLLKQYGRWMFWTVDGEGKKTPRKVTEQKDRNIDPNNSSNWGSWDQLIAASHKYRGPGFALGHVDNGPTFGGIDLDDCRDPKTGVIEEWAWKVIRAANSYTEISPSGTGVKIFITGALRDEDTSQGKVYRLEIYDRKRYFTVTGHHLAGTPTTVESRETALRILYARQRSTDLVELTKLFGLFKRDRGEWIDLSCPWAEDHSTPDGSTDCSLHLDKEGHVDGFKCLHASHAETKSLGDVLNRFGLKGTHTGFVTNAKGDIIADHQENIRRALERLGIQLSHNVFAQKLLATQNGRTEPFEDPLLDRAWLLVDEEFHFRGSFLFFKTVLADTARRKPFHPVRDYLATLTWDGTERINSWLPTYGGALNTKYVQAVGALVLIAAVRRVRQPGCKFDEMLVLESGGQGLNKSTALRALCPDDAWFGDRERLTSTMFGRKISERFEKLRDRTAGVIYRGIARRSDWP